MRSPRLPAALLGASLAMAGGAASAAPPLETAGASHIRSAPRADAPIIGQLAPRRRIAPDTYTGVEFEIVGSKDGWLLLKKDEDVQADFTLDAAHAADGRGWVSGRLVGITLGAKPSMPARPSMSRSPAS
jgi:hypothetical protein